MLQSTPNTVQPDFPKQKVKVSIDIAYRLPGNVIKHTPVEFQVIKNEGRFIVVPLCNNESRRLTNLPANLWFEIVNGKIRTAIGIYEEVIDAIMHELVKMKIILATMQMS